MIGHDDVQIHRLVQVLKILNALEDHRGCTMQCDGSPAAIESLVAAVRPLIDQIDELMSTNGMLSNV